MKKLIVIIAILSLGVLTAQSQIGRGKMIAGGGFGLSALGMGATGNFEYGLSDKMGVMLSVGAQSYNSSGYDWSFIPVDVWVTYHSDKFKTGILKNFEDIDMFIMGGVTMTSYNYSNSSTDESSSSIAIGFGSGFRKPLKDKISVFGEGRYRLASFEYTGGAKLSVFWYSITAGISYTIN